MYKEHIIYGKLYGTNIKVKMVSNGYWIGENNKHITSYLEYGKEDNKQYSLLRKNGNWFILECEN